MDLPRYDLARDYAWNWEHPPTPVEMEMPPWPTETQFLGRPLDSPLGMPAGPLLNGKWLLYYASLGFDTLVYKTVRSQARVCYPLPNLAPVDAAAGFDLSSTGQPRRTQAVGSVDRSWAVSFGMPSKPPNQWRRDVEETRRQLPDRKLLGVSVVGTVEAGAGIEALAADFARCAGWAIEAGADFVECNFSCPNVATADGQLFQQPAAAAAVAREVRTAIGPAPLGIKLGRTRESALVDALVRELSEPADFLAMTNTIPAQVATAEGRLLFDGAPRGIAGAAILEASVSQLAAFRAAIEAQHSRLELVGVGGAFTSRDVQRYLDAGAACVQMATAPMLDPLVAVKIRSRRSPGFH